MMVDPAFAEALLFLGVMHDAFDLIAVVIFHFGELLRRLRNVLGNQAGEMPDIEMVRIHAEFFRNRDRGIVEMDAIRMHLRSEVQINLVTNFIRQFFGGIHGTCLS
jgi:hypothetical protein